MQNAQNPRQKSKPNGPNIPQELLICDSMTVYQRRCKYPSHKYKYKYLTLKYKYKYKYSGHKYKYKYLKLTIKYNTSTGTSMSLIKNQTAPALNEYRSVSYYIIIYTDFTSLQYCRCYCLFRDELTVG